MDVGPHTMLTILDQAIQVERDRINKLIDMEIDNRINNKKK